MAIVQGSYGQVMDYTVDMVFCIDATGSMEDFTGSQKKIINMVKQNAINFYSDFHNVMANKGKKVRQLRVRIVAFRDYTADGEHAMMVTDFFQLPQQAAEFAVTSLKTAWKRWLMRLSPSGQPKAQRSVRLLLFGRMRMRTILDSVKTLSIIRRECPVIWVN